MIRTPLHLYIYWTAVCFCMALSVSSCRTQVEESELNKAGDNREEMLKVLNHFQKNGSNIEYKSSVFLINNMPYHSSFRGHLVEHYDEGYAEMAAQPIAQRDPFYKQLCKKLGRDELYYDYDIHLVNSRQLINSINHACTTWEETGWHDMYEDDVFFNYVLPYKVSNESVSNWRAATKSLYPRLGKNEVRSKRGPKIEFEEGIIDCQTFDVVGASGKVVVLAHQGDSVTIVLDSERATRKSLWLRYSCPDKQAKIRVATNGSQCQIVNLIPSNDPNTFIYSQNIIDIELKKGRNTIVLAYNQKSVALDYMHLQAVEPLPKDFKEGFALGSSLINQKFGKALTFSKQTNINSSSIVLLTDYNPDNEWQSLDLCLRGYGSYTISPLTVHRDTLCLEAQYSNCHVGTRSSQYRFIGSAHQLWTFIPTRDGKYRIMGRDSGLFLEAREEKGELRLFLTQYAEHQDSQLWEIKESKQQPSVLYSQAIREAMKVYDYMHLWKWCPCNVTIPPTSATLLKSRTGNCHEEACFVVNLCRYLGIPAAIDFTPHWGNRSQAHEWSVLIDESSRGIPFYMSKIPGDTTNSFNGYKKPKVFRNRFSVDKRYDSTIKKSKLPEPWLMFPCYEDVTFEYCAVSSVKRNVPDSISANGTAYICVFDNRRWVPVFWGDIENGSVTFENMAREIMYIAAIINEQGSIHTFGTPFYIDKTGTVKDIEINLNAPQSMTLFRKFPFLGKQDPFNLRMSMGRFQASKTSDFEKCVDLYYFTGITNGNWYEVSVDNEREFQYLRYIGPSGSYCNINELQFMGKDGKQLKGSIIGTQGKVGHEKETVFDGNILTGFEGISPDGHWVGIKLQRPSRITKIRFIGRNDGNTIEIGDNYELFYWHNNKWNSINKRIADDCKLIYDSVPSNGLYVLKNNTKGWEERIFTYQDGEQIWW